MSVRGLQKILLVVFEFEGKFWLVPAKHEDDDGDAPDIEANRFPLSRPPSAPKGTWRRVERYDASIRALAQLQEFTMPRTNPELLTSRLYEPFSGRDSNGIYFKKGRAGKPSKSVAFTCEQWRHASDPEVFTMAIWCPLKPGVYAGLLKVTVHAANLTTPAFLSLPLRLTVEEASCFGFAEQMVADLDA